VIDGSILWHGSLNILSHNDTRESMLRIESPVVVREVMDGLGIAPDAANQAASELPSAEAVDEAVHTESPACPECGQPMIRYDRTSMWICRRSPQCSGTLPVTVPERTPKREGALTDNFLELACPLCGAAMQVHRGITSRIVCPSSTCGFQLDSRLSAGILSVLRRRGVL
jgi:hypothetical protein